MQNTIFQRPIFLALFSAILLSLAWYVPLGCLTLFVAFVPLFYIAENAKKKWLLVYVALFLWNLATTWWVWNASAGGAVAMLFANTLLMTIPWGAYLLLKKYLGKWSKYFLVTVWILFEYAHLNWDLSWSWLNLGNGFAYTHTLVQWYEYTGTLGGTLWVLLVNVFLYEFFVEKRKNRLPWVLVLYFCQFLFP